ncbi:phospholipase D-like domain-containing protein [Rhodohalobacter sp. 614A]|uniref:phospholipase D-like domain-containing protein n=1 Tax=Rhodohalobacter sp. 614A TaxID=2908649 RepID=UPI001F1FFFA2|nr:phospholipase D-like domain-containing protein [Rhodohalobacter sp. 614A]
MKTIFENIEQSIISEINQAKKWIKISVPWFTSVELLQSLYSAESRGIDIELIIEDDKVNNKLKKLFEGLERLGCKVIFNKNKEKLNHEKFALIDGETLIYGSYNWTNKANLYNNESIFIIDKDENKSILIHTNLDLIQ